MNIADNIDKVRAIIKASCDKSHRLPTEVNLIAVSKTRSIDEIMVAYNKGIRDFGENRVQEITLKAPQLPSDIRWHMIGHLQSNKVKEALLNSRIIHSVDSIKLAKKLNDEATKLDISIDIYIEINIGYEDSKYGISPDAVMQYINDIKSLNNINIIGLMCVAPHVDKAEDNRPLFRQMNDLLVDINDKSIDNVYVHELSMGMSNDYAIAIEEGATSIRVGSDIFGTRSYS